MCLSVGVAPEAEGDYVKSDLDFEQNMAANKSVFIPIACVLEVHLQLIRHGRLVRMHLDRDQHAHHLDLLPSLLLLHQEGI